MRRYIPWGVKLINLKKNFDVGSTNAKSFLNISSEERKMVLEWRNHENVRKWMYSDKIISRMEHADFLSELAEDDENIYWMVGDNDGNFLGTISFNRTDFKHKHAYLGIYSNPFNDIKNKGHLLIQCVKKLAFEIAGLHTLKLEVISNNQKAINFYKKSGFSEEGRLKEFVFKDGQWYDVIIMGITDDS